MLRPGNAGSNTAADHIEATRLGLAQLPRRLRRRVLVRADSGGGTQDFLAWLAKPGRRLAYSVGFTITEEVQQAILTLPGRVWEPPMTRAARSGPAPGSRNSPACWTWRTGQQECGSSSARNAPTPARKPRFTDIDGHRFTCFATCTKRGQAADLELRHRRRARCEDRIRCAKDTGLRNLPLQGFMQNQAVVRRIVAVALRTAGAWMQMLRPGRPRPQVGAETAAAADLHLRRAPRPRRPPPAAPPRRQAGPGRRRSPPRSAACTPSHPADPAEAIPNDQERTHLPGPWNPAHPARQPGHHS